MLAPLEWSGILSVTCGMHPGDDAACGRHWGEIALAGGQLTYASFGPARGVTALEAMLTLSDTQVTLERNVHLNPTDLLAHVQSFADNSARIATTVPSLTAVPHRSALLEPTAPLPQPSPANIATTPRINAATPPRYADSARFQVWPRLTAIAGEMVGLALLAQIPAVLIVLLIVLTTH